MSGHSAGRQKSGRDLAAERVRRSVRAIRLAERMGVSRQRVTAIEQLHRVRPELVARYFEALDELASA